MASASKFNINDTVRYNSDAKGVMRGWGLDQHIRGTGIVKGKLTGDQDTLLLVRWSDKEDRIIHPVHLEKE